MNNMECPDVRNLFVIFVTKQIQYAVPDTPFFIESDCTTEKLNQIIKGLLQKGVENVPNFDFLIGNELLRSDVKGHLDTHHISTEGNVSIEYFVATPTPKPQDKLQHDDWVASVHISDKGIITGCYDNSIHLWSKKGEHLKSIVGHDGAVMAVRWVSVNDEQSSFVTASSDQSVSLWRMTGKRNKIQRVTAYEGHAEAVTSVDVNRETSQLATGSWDNTIKLWNLSLNENSESLSKKIKLISDDDDNLTPKIQMELASYEKHHGAVTGVKWMSSDKLVSSSWDHTLKIWDTQVGCVDSEINADKSLNSVDYCPSTDLILASSCDRVRMFDIRSGYADIVKKVFCSHLGWIEDVCWCSVNPNLFVSAGFDMICNIWDIRSTMAPLYNLSGHTGRIMCVDWSDGEVVLSGAQDNTLRIYATPGCNVK